MTTDNGATSENRTGSWLVVIGSSAGGVDALSALVQTLPADFPAPIVIAQHLDPERLSHLGEILSRRSTLPVRTLTGVEEPLVSGTVYVAPANRHVEITDHAVRLQEWTPGRPKPSINLLLETAAQMYGEKLIAVILTGTGSDGTAGARSVKEAGGTVVIQNPDTASFPAMPRSLAPSTVDVVTDLKDLSGVLSRLLADNPDEAGATESDTLLESFLASVRERSGIDFSAYKRPMIIRRLQRRFIATGVGGLAEYNRYIHRHPEEYQRLVSSFLIKVTEFFRDRDLFDYLRNQLLPELIDSARLQQREVRVWSAGCATGEEAYSLAILIAELLGDDVETMGVRIFATDLDTNAVAFARRGVYPGASLSQLPPELIERYFDAVDGEFEVRKRLRSMIVFGQHDLGQRAPFPRIDLVLCRNVLIYFTAELQKRALQLFALSLTDGGALVLGKAETVGAFGEYFALEQSLLRVYRRHGDRVLIPTGRFRAASVRSTGTPLPPTLRKPASAGQGDAPLARAPERTENVLLHLPIGVVSVDRRYDISQINNSARRLLGVHGRAIGDDLIHMVQTAPPLALREAIDAALRGEPTITGFQAPEVDPGSDAPRYLELSCSPMRSEVERGAIVGAVLLVRDVSAGARTRRSLEERVDQQQSENIRASDRVERLSENNRQLIRANEELAEINTELRGANEELLVAYEEVQSTTEELETLNEEMQATNEELETLNEELQATVEELNTTNDELESRSIEMQDLAANVLTQRQESEQERARLSAILLSMDDAILVVDSAGGRVLTNAAFDALAGDDQPRFSDESGEPLPPEQQPEQRVARGESFRVELTATGPDGEQRWYEASGRPILNDGELNGGVVAIRDITDRSLRALQNQFIAMASHELRTPLTAASGYIQMLLRQIPAEGAAAQRQYAEGALQQTRRMITLVNDLLDVARLQSGRLRLALAPMDLSEAVCRAVTTGEALAPEKTLSCDRSDQPLIVNGDTGRLEQVVLNLLTNAITHAPQSDRIDVRVRQQEGWAVVEVQDYGPGIPAAALSRIFSRFYQVAPGERDRRDGLGLGLFIASEIVNGHGGRIEVASTEGEGTKFSVWLPLAQAE